MIQYMPLGDICTDIIDCPHESPDWKEDGIAVIRNFNLVNGQIDMRDGYFVDEETFKRRTRRAIPSEGDIIFSREAPIGNCAIVPPQFKCCLGQRLVLLRVNHNVCTSEYLLSVLQSAYVKKQIEQVSKQGSIVSNFAIGDLHKLVIPVLDNQDDVATFDDTVSRKLSNNNAICADLEAMAKLLYDYWFVQFDFPDENGKPYKSSGGKMVWNEDLKREIPEGWEAGTFKDMLDIGNGRDHKGLSEGNIPVYGSGGLMRKVNTSLYTGESVLIPRKGTLNNIMYVNESFWTVDTMFYTKMKRKHIGKYMYYATKHYDFERLNTGTGVPSMTTEIIYNLRVLIPDDRILKLFDTIITPWYETINHNIDENERLISLRDFLLPMLMNGQVKVGGKGDLPPVSYPTDEARDEFMIAAEPQKAYDAEGKGV